MNFENNAANILPERRLPLPERNRLQVELIKLILGDDYDKAKALEIFQIFGHAISGIIDSGEGQEISALVKEDKYHEAAVLLRQILTKDYEF